MLKAVPRTAEDKEAEVEAEKEETEKECCDDKRRRRGTTLQRHALKASRQELV